MESVDLGIPEGLEDFDAEAFELEFEGAMSSNTTESSESSSESSEADLDLDNVEDIPMLSEDDIIRGRNSRYGRGRSISIDYGSRGSSSHEFEQSPEQALVSRSLQLLRTIPRFQYEALSWIPNLLKVQDTQAEISAEEAFDYEYEVIPLQIQNKQYVEFVDHRIGIFGDVGVGKTALLQSYMKNTDNVSTLATNGVDYSEKLIVKDTVCHRFLFSDFSGQERLYPILKGYMKSLQAAILVVDVSDVSTMKYILFAKQRIVSLIVAIITFYLPSLLESCGSTLVVYIVLNKSDLKSTIKKKDVVNVCKSFFPDCVITVTGFEMRKNVNSLFRNVMKSLLIDKNDDGCILFI